MLPTYYQQGGGMHATIAGCYPCLPSITPVPRHLAPVPATLLPHVVPHVVEKKRSSREVQGDDAGREPRRHGIAAHPATCTHCPGHATTRPRQRCTVPTSYTTPSAPHGTTRGRHWLARPNPHAGAHDATRAPTPTLPRPHLHRHLAVDTLERPHAPTRPRDLHSSPRFHRTPRA